MTTGYIPADAACSCACTGTPCAPAGIANAVGTAPCGAAAAVGICCVPGATATGEAEAATTGGGDEGGAGCGSYAPGRAGVPPTSSSFS